MKRFLFYDEKPWEFIKNQHLILYIGFAKLSNNFIVHESWYLYCIKTHPHFFYKTKTFLMQIGEKKRI